LATLVQFYAIDSLGLSQNLWWGKISLAQSIHNLFYTVPLTSHEWIIPILWTLSVEFQFYIFLALVFGLMFRSGASFITMSALLLACSFLPLAQTLQFLLFSPFFLMGGAALMHQAGRLNLAQYIVLLTLFTGVAWYAVALTPAIFGLGTACLISWVPVRAGVLLFLGKISYSLYLTHILVGSTFEYLILRVIEPDGDAGKIACQLLTLAVAIAAAWIFWRIFERPFILLSGRLFPRQPKAVSEPGL
jgi:peptidoglycan/LPS O-acetylase OafA/YrhL